MKRLLCIIIAVGIGFLSYADNQSGKTQNEYKVLSEKLTSFSNQADEINELLKKFLDSGKKMQQLINDQQKEKEQLINDKQNAEKTISCPLNCKMLIEYPLMVKYDSLLVAHSLKTINNYKLADQKENKDLCRIWIPILTDYGKYYKSVYDVIRQIRTSYIEFNQPYSMDLFNANLEKTTYYKGCYNKGFKINYLDVQIKAVEILISEDRLTSGNIDEIIDNMK